RRLPHLAYADLRLEVTESRHAIAENGAERSSGDDYACTAGVRVLAGERSVAPGWLGIVLGAADVADLEARLREALERAYRRAMGACSVVAVTAETSQELYDVMGHQRGWEVIAGGVDDPLLAFPPFRDFALALAHDAAELAAAPPLPSSEREVVVVTDPHYNTLVSHEIVGHPAELDRALKMETAYAGRAWLLGDLDRHQVGRRIASPLVP